MSDVRVLVVDDSAAMRALFSDILDQAKGVEVVGLARNADDAREQIAKLKPDVLTLDVEMPGMTGMEFLAELMQTNPLPVVMLSSVTQDGTGTAQKALDLGAFDCFPKPLHSTPEEFQATVARLGKLVIDAASADLTARTPGAEKSGGAKGAPFVPDGRLVAIAASADSIEILREIIAGYPSNCPPTIFLVDGDEGFVDKAIDRLRPSVACRIEDAKGDMVLVTGSVYIHCDRSRHVLVEDDFAPMLKLVEKDPIGGFRPSADMFFASIARCGTPAMGGMLAAGHTDGIRGLEALAASGAQTFMQDADAVGPNVRCDAAKAMAKQPHFVSGAALPDWIVSTTSKQVLAA